MFVLALALFAAPVALPAVEPQRAHQKRTARRTVRRTRGRTAALRVKPVLPACRAGSVLSRCAPRDRNAQYRLGYVPDETVDFKARALNGPFKNCGVTGMPVCPSKGQTLVETNPR
ncbi:MAG: hypothetical protein V4574_12570 [Pseudomonadota bacterium]